MMNKNRSILVLFSFLMGYPVAAEMTYVPVTTSFEPGHAPGLKIQTLTTPNDKVQEYALIFGKGDEVGSGLIQFAQQYKITSAHFTGVGALSDVTLGWFDCDRKAYKAIPLHEQVELLSLIGDIALYKGKPAVHAHLVVGQSDGSARGGHLLESHVFPTLELMVTVDPQAMKKTLDPETGLALIDPS